MLWCNFTLIFFPHQICYLCRMKRRKGKKTNISKTSDYCLLLLFSNSFPSRQQCVINDRCSSSYFNSCTSVESCPLSSCSLLDGGTSDDSVTFSTQCFNRSLYFSRCIYLSPLCTHLVILLVRCRVARSLHPVNAKFSRSGSVKERKE